MWRESLAVRSSGRGFTEITDRLARFVKHHPTGPGLLNVFISHTSASLVVSENADPDVRIDLERFMSGLVRDGDPRFTHTAEGPDDMSAHVRSVLTLTSLNLPVEDGRLLLGTWQGVYIWEHRTRPHSRQVILTLMG